MWRLVGGSRINSVSPVDSAVAFWPRAKLVHHIRDTEGLALCGRGAPCPG